MATARLPNGTLLPPAKRRCIEANIPLWVPPQHTITTAGRAKGHEASPAHLRTPTSLSSQGSLDSSLTIQSIPRKSSAQRGLDLLASLSANNPSTPPPSPFTRVPGPVHASTPWSTHPPASSSSRLATEHSAARCIETGNDLPEDVYAVTRHVNLLGRMQMDTNKDVEKIRYYFRRRAGEENSITDRKVRQCKGRVVLVEKSLFLRLPPGALEDDSEDEDGDGYESGDEDSDEDSLESSPE